jgi:Zn-dependent metalloprotease
MWRSAMSAVRCSVASPCASTCAAELSTYGLAMSNLLESSEVVWGPSRVRPIKVSGQFQLPQAASTIESVKEFLRTHAQELALHFPVEGLSLHHEGKTPARTVYRFRANIDNIPVLDGEMLVHVDTHQRVIQLDNTVGPTNIVAPPAGAKQLNADEAFKAASGALGSYTKRMTGTQAGLVLDQQRPGARLRGADRHQGSGARLADHR